MPRRTFITVDPLEPRRLLAAVPMADLAVSDIPEPLLPATSGTAVSTPAGDVFYFARTTDAATADNSYLWRSDGTPAGTQIVTPLNRFEDATNFFPFNNNVYFIQTSRPAGNSGFLWKTDGTAAGTVRIDVALGNQDLPDAQFTPSGGVLYFVSNGLWKTDGTTAGTSRLTTADAKSPADFNGTLYFLTPTGLWKSGGTAATTVQVKALETSYYTPSPILVEGGAMFFVRDGDLYRSDGTQGGTTVLHDATSRLLASEAAVTENGRIFFTSISNGVELYTSDGTAAGTALVKDIHRGGYAPALRDLTPLGDTLYFVADDGSNGEELWKSDGTAAGTVTVDDLLPGPRGSSPQRLTAHGGRLYFSALHHAVGRELYVTDGTESGTRPVADLFPGEPGSLPHLVLPGATKLLFTALHPAAGYSAYALGAPDAAPTHLADLVPGALNRRTPIAGTVEGDVYYADGDARRTGREMHMLPFGGPAGRLVEEIGPGEAGSDPDSIVPLGNNVAFRATSTFAGTEIWRAVPTGVWPLTDAVPADAANSNVSLQGPFGSPAAAARAFANFSWNLPPQPDPGAQTFFRESWSVVGAPAAAAKLGDFNVGPIVERGDWLYYLAGGFNTATLTRMSRDGATRQPIATVPANPPTSPSPPPARELRAVGNVLYFAAHDRLAGEELWRSDGTAAGTFQVKDLAPGALHSSPRRFTPLRGDTAVFTAGADARMGIDEEIWVTDGTAANTRRLADLRPGSAGSAPRDLVHFDGAVYFTANDGTGGRELWKTDGTTAGTIRVADLYPGPTGSDPAELKVLAGKLYFAATDPAGGRELWSTDGTAAGTVRAADVNPGPASSDPMNLTDVGGNLYFTANDGTAPRLYRIEHPAPHVAARHVFYNNSSRDGRSPQPDARDDNAIALDKAALLPGQTPTFSNVTSYTRGLNGVMIDIANRPPRELRPEDFYVRVGRGPQTTWRRGPDPLSVTVRRLPGPGAVDRVTLVFPDGALRNTWAQVTMASNWRTGLANHDIFYFGNLVGAAGTAEPTAPVGGPFSASTADYLTLRRTRPGIAARTSRFDFDRDGYITPLDLATVRRALTSRITLATFTAPPQ